MNLPDVLASKLNTATWLEARASLHPHRRAVIEPIQRCAKTGSNLYRTTTFEQLELMASRYARGLERAGICQGDRVISAVRPGVELIAISFALYKLGAAPVFIDPGMGKENLLNCVEQARAKALIGGEGKVFLAAAVKRKQFQGVKLRISLGKCLMPGVKNLYQLIDTSDKKFPARETSAENMAALLFTSGSTGPAKGVVYSHRIFCTQIDVIARDYGVTDSDVDMSIFPLFGLFAVAMGMPTVIPDMDTSKPASADPERVLRVMNDQAVTFSFGSPAFWRVMADYCEPRKIRFDSIRVLVMAGCSVPAELHKRFLDNILPKGADILVPYGATESLPLCTYRGTQAVNETQALSNEGAGTCVGPPMSTGTEIKIIRITDDAIDEWSDELCLAPGEKGEICAYGPIVTQAYYHREDANIKSKIKDPRGGVWHRVGDIGYFDEQGRLWFCGRKGERVETSAQTVFTDPLENIFNTIDGLKRSAVCGLADKSQTNTKTACLVLECEEGQNSESQRKTIIARVKELMKKYPQCQALQSAWFHPGFPVDVRHNAKIKRDLLARWIEENLNNNQGIPLK